MIVLSHKIRIYPNQQARQYLAKCFGTARFAYNWAIDECKRSYDRGEKCPSGYDLSKRLNAIKREKFPWMVEVTKWAPQQAVTRYENPKALRSNLNKLKRLQRSLSRKKKGSQNRKKVKQKLSRLHLRIWNIRQDAIHKMTSEIVRNFRFIGIEDLNVSGMMKNHKLAQSIQDASFYEIRRQLEYKAKLSRSEVIPIHRFYPSSKICSLCGWKSQSLKLSDRTLECAACGIVQDRDLNAARNIEKVALGHRETINACGAPKGALRQEA